MIKYQTYSVGSVILMKSVLGAYINSFWLDVFHNFTEDAYLRIIFKIKFADNSLGYRTIGKLKSVEFTDKELYIEYICENLAILDGASDIDNPISQIIFSYIERTGKAPFDQTIKNEVLNTELKFHRYNNVNLPCSMNPEDFGRIIVQKVLTDKEVTRFIVIGKNRTYTIDQNMDKSINKVKIEGLADLNWIDTKIDQDSFRRDIGKSEFIIFGGEKVLRKKVIPAKPFSRVQPHSTLTTDFITMDIETTLDSGAEPERHIPYLISAFDGQNYINSYLPENLVGQLAQNALFENFIEQLLKYLTNQKRTLIVYAHNFGGFDGIFLMEHLLKFGIVKPLIFKGKLISIKLQIKDGDEESNKHKTVIFKDSYLLLPLSLRKLAKAFNLNILKSYFPFNLFNIFYTGPFPDFNYWTDISFTLFKNLKKGIKLWDFKIEATKYCQLDCKILHIILGKFSELIFSEFSINIHSSRILTLPGLAMAIYKSQFMPENKIFQILGLVEKNIRQSYSGASVDVYKSLFLNQEWKGVPDTKLFYYDINSLYPFIMAQTSMPIGRPIAFDGDIRKYEPNAYGFFYCQIISPGYIKHPILQRKCKTIDGYRTIAGLGSWTGWIYSLEMDNAIKLGYKIKIIRGYQFEQGNIFENYIERMYELRLRYDKSNPMNLIAKLLMNSLYGRFGMSVQKTDVLIFNCNKVEDIEAYKKLLANDKRKDNIIDILDSTKLKLVVRNVLTPELDESEDIYHGIDVNVAIASAITAGARSLMSAFKNNPNFNLYYSDTDSIVIDRSLSTVQGFEDTVGPEIGQMKLEYIIKRAVFLAPKVYGLITNEGHEIIKIKGLTKDKIADLHIEDLEKLLVKDEKLRLSHRKFQRKLEAGSVSMKQLIYTLRVTSNKRNVIYDENGIFIATKPFYYDEIIKE
jgi:DNA polymerase type B, organellar and viral